MVLKAHWTKGSNESELVVGGDLDLGLQKYLPCGRRAEGLFCPGIIMIVRCLQADGGLLMACTIDPPCGNVVVFQ